LLARELPTQEYGIVSLVLGIVAVAGLMAPLGLDQVAARRGIRLDAGWRRAALGACALTAVAVAIGAALVYHLPAAAAVWWLVRRREGAGGRQPTAWGVRSEAMSLLTVQTCSSAFIQLERL